MQPFILNIHKPVDVSSAKVVSYFKKGFKKQAGKIGHFGTLDPFASGILLLGFGGASRLADYVHKYLPKTYVAVGKLGELSSTGDLMGEIIERKEVCAFENGWKEKLEEKFRGEYWQKPPAFSATKHEGKALYKYAREGITIDKPAVKREIFDFKIIDFNADTITFEATVSSGTYIRVLFEDMARELGQVGHLTALTRTRIGPLTLDDSVREDSWEKVLDLSKGPLHMPMDHVLPLPRLTLDAEKTRHYLQGRPMPALRDRVSGQLDSHHDELCWVIEGSSQNILGLARFHDEKPVVVFNLPQVP